MILVTGASGFVGRAVVTAAAAKYFGAVRAVHRTPRRDFDTTVDAVVVSDLGADWTAALRGVTTIVHCAARVHVMRDSAADPLTEFRRINVDGTLNLARQAAQSGARRFVFISSIKVNGESTELGTPFTAQSAADPRDPYGVSKHEAEQGLRVLSATTGLEVVVIRPVLVYGPGAKGNFRSMLRWLHRGVPLPLAGIANRRSLVALDNLVDLILTSVDHPAAAGQTLLVSDGEDLSTTELLRRAARAIGATPRLFPIPSTFLRAAGGLTGRSGAIDRLIGTLQVDIERTRAILRWSPRVSVDEALTQTARAFLASGGA